MAINFPASPSTNDTHTENAITWIFNGTSWDAQDVPVTAASIGLGSVDNTSDADKPVSTATQAALDDKQDAAVSSLSMQDTAGLVPFRLPENISPFTDPDADAVIAATSTTDERGINHYQRIVQLIKGLGVWSSLQDAYLIGSDWQDNVASLKSITGNNVATGTCTFDTYAGTFNGSSDGYTVPNNDQGTGKTGKTFFAIFKNTAKSAGASQTSVLLSNYEGGVNQGLVLSASAFGGNGPSLLDDIGTYGTVDGSAGTKLSHSGSNDYKYSTAITSLNDGTLSLYPNAFNPQRLTLATTHNNNATYGLGKNANNSYHFNGEIVFAGILDAGVSDFQAFALRLGLESILSDVIDWPGSIVFEGNSLTGQASGGGSPYPTKLMTKAGWTDIKRWANIADGGAEQTQKVEAQYFTEARQWMAIAGQKSMFIIWSGINDISNIAGLTTAELTASLQRSIQRSKAEGFWVGLIPLTPVANQGDGLTYGYTAAQQTLLAETNAWMETTGARLADQFIDIRLIGDADPEFLDPTDDTYYTTGDGLHHNDVGRQKIADYIDSVVNPPAN